MKVKKYKRAKLFITLFVFSMLMFLTSINGFSQSTLGDVNSDQSVDIVDALLIAQYYVDLNPAQFNPGQADVNCDSRIDIVDALLIAQYYVSLISQFPCQTTTTAPTPTPFSGTTNVPTPPNLSYSVNKNIKINSIGFPPDREKVASISAGSGSFSVKRYSDDSVVFTGSASRQIGGVYQADFSSLTEEGIFYLDVAGVGKSAPFEIGNNVFDFPFYTVVRGMYLWRCGTSVSGTHYGVTFSHAACHTNDGYDDYITGSHSRRDGTGGWHDAGDYGKYIVNTGVTLGLMFKAWENFQSKLENVNLNIPESGGSLPDYLDEIKFEMDWVLKMQYADGTGRVSHKLTRTNFSGFVKPENDTDNRFFVPWGSAATADFVAMCAMAARIFQPYNPSYAQVCLNAAVKSYDFLAANTSYHAADQSGFSTGGYESTKFQDRDDRLWAAAEMWETTGESRYLTDFENRANSFNPKIDTDFDWDNTKNLGMITYLMSHRSGRNSSLVNQIQNAVISEADGMVSTSNSDAYGRPLGDSYYWGCNGGVARQTLILQTAYTLTSNSDYLDTAMNAVSHLFGRNTYCRSYVTGLGFDPPMYPHDRRSGSDGIADPWPGYLVGGGHSETGWVDNQDNYETNEIAINWNGAFIYALAGFLP
ncbi:MAG: glycoside hydrolase family 9 protein [Spirochaetales bacterium]|nr:glycoside hydrolase family 9 protein [Spirochaetales bacterium]